MKRQDLKLVRFGTQQEFLKVFPPADSAYHDYAEMAGELQQAAFDHPAIFSLFSVGIFILRPAVVKNKEIMGDRRWPSRGDRR